jgi:hypothetical protein
VCATGQSSAEWHWQPRVNLYTRREAAAASHRSLEAAAARVQDLLGPRLANGSLPSTHHSCTAPSALTRSPPFRRRPFFFALPRAPLLLSAEPIPPVPTAPSTLASHAWPPHASATARRPRAARALRAASPAGLPRGSCASAGSCVAPHGSSESASSARRNAGRWKRA